MVSSVTSAPYSYLNQLLGASTTTATSTSGASTATTVPATSTASSGSGTSTAQSLVSSLLSGGAFSSEALSLLQQDSSGSFDPISTLLGGTSTNDPLTSEYANLYATVESAALQQAKTDNTSAVTPASTIDNLVNTQTQASIAYNQTLQQNVANILTANSYGPDGVTPLVS